MTRVSWEFSNEGTSMADKTPKKPQGFKEFDGLLKKLVQVPKDELDKQLSSKKKRIKKK